MVHHYSINIIIITVSGTLLVHPVLLIFPLVLESIFVNVGGHLLVNELHDGLKRLQGVILASTSS